MKLTNKILLALLACLMSSIAPAATAAPTKSIVLSKNNTIVLTGEVNGESTAQVISQAKDLTSKATYLARKKPLYLFLNTPGGSIQSGLEMIEALKGVGRPVNTITLFAASMGWQIVQSLDERLILKNGVMMSHHAYGQQEGEFGGSIKTQMESRQQLWNDRVRELDEQTVARTKGKQTYESYTKEYDHEMWLTGTKSVAEGYSDQIVTVKCDETLNGVTTHHLNFLGLDIQYDLDNCPLNTSPMNVRIGSPESGKAVNEVVANLVKQEFLANYENKLKTAIPLY